MVDIRQEAELISFQINGYCQIFYTWLSSEKIPTPFKYEKLLVWQEAMDLGEEFNLVAMKLPSFELYNLPSQLRKSAELEAFMIFY